MCQGKGSQLERLCTRELMRESTLICILLKSFCLFLNLMILLVLVDNRYGYRPYILLMRIIYFYTSIYIYILYVVLGKVMVYVNSFIFKVFQYLISNKIKIILNFGIRPFSIYVYKIYTTLN